MILVGNYYKMLELSSFFNFLVNWWIVKVDLLFVIIFNYLNFYNVLIIIEENSSGELKVKVGGYGWLLEDFEFLIGIIVV